MRDILDEVPPTHVPGVLYEAMWRRLYDHYPASRKKAQRVTINLLELLIAHYEAEGNNDEQ